MMQAATRAAFAMVFILGAAAGRADAGDLELCFTRSGSFRIDVDVCGRAMKVQDISALTRATLLLRRGQAYLEGKAYQLALADFKAALKRNPYSSLAQELIGTAQLETGNYHLSIERYSKAIRLNIHSASAYKGHGLAYFMTGDFLRAIQSFDRSLSLSAHDPETIALRAIALFATGAYRRAELEMRRGLDLSYPYPLGFLWAYLAARRNGRPGTSHLDAAYREIEPDIWPGPLVRTMENAQNESAAWAAARKSDESRRARRELQAAFFIGAKAYLDGERTKARALLQRVTRRPGFFNAVEKPLARQLLSELPR
ncbi:MAG: tetratricopeptide repeat protein [Rickettsiales bacterium]